MDYIKNIMNRVQKIREIHELKETNNLLRKQVEELKKEPQRLIDKMTLMKIQIRELKLENKELRKELNK